MYVVRKPCSAAMSAANEARLPSTTSLWCIEKLPVPEIREPLRAAGLPLTGNKRALAKRLYDSLQARCPASAEDEASSSHSREDQDEQSPSSDADDWSSSADLTRRHQLTRHGRSQRSPGRRRRRGNSRHSRSTSGSTTTGSGSASSSGGSISSHGSSTTSKSSSSRSASSSPRKPREGRGRYRSRAARDRQRSTLADSHITLRRKAPPPSQTRGQTSAPSPASPPGVLS